MASEESVTRVRAQALAAGADVAVAQARDRARADLALARGLVDRIKQSFFELGEALVRLREPAAYASLGYATFEELVRVELGMSPTKARELVAIAANMGADLARGLGKKGAFALVTLCRATPEDDTPAQLIGRSIELPSGVVLDVRRSTTRQKNEAAKEIRGGRGGGRSASMAERAVAAKAQAQLRAAGLKRARVQAVATRPGQPSDLRVDGVPVPELDTMCTALCVRPKRATR